MSGSPAALASVTASARGKECHSESMPAVAVESCCRNNCNNKLQLAELCVTCLLQPALCRYQDVDLQAAETHPRHLERARLGPPGASQL